MRGLADVKVTLYDIFGYLFPGLVALIGLATLFWALFLPRQPLHVFTLKGPEWFAVIVTAYVLGHLIQGVANDLGRLLARAPGPAKSAEERVLTGSFSPDFADAVRELTFADSYTKPATFAYRVCDTAVAQKGSTADREIYQYREGFYRGLVVAFVVVFASLAARAVSDGAAVRSHGDIDPIGTSVFVFLLVVVALATGIVYLRYRRFAEYRVGNAMMSYLILRGFFGQLPAPPTPGTTDGG